MFNLNPFVCGALLDEDGSDGCVSPGSSPRSASRRRSFCRRTHRNPYSTRGLDKFSALLADLEAKRRKIYAQIGPDDISFVRFVYPDSDHCVPIVVRLKDRHHQDPADRPTAEKLHQYSAPLGSNPIHTASAPAPPPEKGGSESTWPGFLIPSVFGNLGRLWRPSCYVPVVVAMILLLLAVTGRSVAIMCTSLIWYWLPTNAAASSSNPRRTTKKVLRRRFSDNSLPAPKTAASTPKARTTATSPQPFRNPKVF